MKEILAAENISFGYQPDKLLLNNFTLRFARESFSALIGPNGSGKSTVFKLLTGYLKPRHGKVSFYQQPLQHFKPQQRARKMAVVPQYINAALPYSVYQLVAMGRMSRLSHFAPVGQRDREEIERALELMDIGHLREQQFNCLSGGEQQRAVIAAAMAQEPELLLLDEPTASLDLGHSHALMRLLCRLNRDKKLTIILISHDIQLAAHYCQQLILLDAGEIVVSGKPEEVIQPEHIMRVYHEAVEIIRDRHGNLLLSPSTQV